MCTICADFRSKRLSLMEAYQIYENLDPTDIHTQEVLDMLNEVLYSESLSSTGSDYQVEDEFVEFKTTKNSFHEEDLIEDEDLESSFWHDDYLKWQDYFD